MFQLKWFNSSSKQNSCSGIVSTDDAYAMIRRTSVNVTDIILNRSIGTTIRTSL